MERYSSTLEDRELSPYTGITREHWRGVARDLLDGAARYRSASGARIEFPGAASQQGPRADGLEGFSRTFLLAAFDHIGAPDTETATRLDDYLQGVVAGTSADPRVEDAWEPIENIGERWGQSQVEAACISLSLHLTKSDTWDRLAPDEQDAVEGWLRTALDKEPSSNNWYLFPLTIASFLEGVGRMDRQTSFVIERGFSLIDQWYRGDGWYSDGDGEAFDHYNGWAIHFYPLLHAWLRDDTVRMTVFRERLRAFVGTFATTFDRTGASLYFGRSLTYRMSASASLAIAQVMDCSPLEPGQSRRIMSSNLRYFLDRGATSNGVLSLGWQGEHAASLQRYSGPGSPYWASKGFAGLLLPLEHPFWTSPESELSADRDDLVRPIAPIGLMIQSTAADGLVRVHNHGSDHLKPHHADDGPSDPLYARFAYSTRTGPTVADGPADNDIRVQFRGIWSVRRRIHHVASGGDWVASWHAPRFPTLTSEGHVLPSARIESVTIAHAHLEVRVHRLRNVPPDSAVELSGWAVASDGPETLIRRAHGLSADCLPVDGRGPSSRVIGIEGWTYATTAAATGGTAFGRWAAVPQLRGSAATQVLVALVSLSADPGANANDLSDLAEIEIDASTVRVTWSDSLIGSSVNLDDLPWT
ncbi:DUF2264 domain-containing protein (plasmid) [Glaciihabitans sp. INWT7]|nr:DUF2264 domain-containing protein [Glaciihabitans sp. INWT7]